VRAPAIASSAAASPRIPVRWSATDTGNGFTVQVRRTSGRSPAWRTLLRSSTRRSLTFRGAPGATYQFRVQAVTTGGVASAWATATTISPTDARVRGGHYRGAWRLAKVRSAWNGHAMVTSNAGDSFTLSYVGGSLAVIGDRWPQGGRARVTLDGRSRTINFHSRRPHARQVLGRVTTRYGRHRLTLQVLRGVAAFEGLAITNRLG
jgi:hypothetical protein